MDMTDLYYTLARVHYPSEGGCRTRTVDGWVDIGEGSERFR